MDPFHDDSWATPWHSSEFPPEETPRQTSRRIEKMPEWPIVRNYLTSRFFQDQTLHTGGWPWGYVIYRTSFTTTSDRDWAAAIGKLDEYCYAAMARFRDVETFRFQPDIHELVREGYRNVLVQDPNLEGASVDAIRKRHIQWVEWRGYHFYLGTPRFDYCVILDDRAIRSILASSEPGTQNGLVGYVNVVDCDFNPNGPENECSEYYDGSLRICLTDLFNFALYCEDLKTGEQQWGDWGLERPGKVIYTDGHSSLVEKQDVFLCPTDYDCFSRSCYPQIPEKETVTESQYIELQTAIV
ncbi:hypothetical protein N7451_004660 [Penicillium sp. IBT 35674x]|nr:hypothetical protein N7451_004660 [Penicillium sp. IBT 35674x]